MGIGQPLLSRAWSMTCSRPDPRASGPPRFARESEPNVRAHRDILNLLQPKDSPQGLLIRAELAEADGNFDKAAELYGQMVQAGASANFRFGQANCVEKAASWKSAGPVPPVVARRQQRERRQ